MELENYFDFVQEDVIRIKAPSFSSTIKVNAKSQYTLVGANSDSRLSYQNR